MTTATLERVTTAEFLARADQDDYELIDGELKERCMGMEAAWVATQFATRLTNFNNEHRLGTVVGDNTPLQIFGERQTRSEHCPPSHPVRSRSGYRRGRCCRSTPRNRLMPKKSTTAAVIASKPNKNLCRVIKEIILDFQPADL